MAALRVGWQHAQLQGQVGDPLGHVNVHERAALDSENWALANLIVNDPPNPSLVVVPESIPSALNVIENSQMHPRRVVAL
jgi:hypothetical protein